MKHMELESKIIMATICKTKLNQCYNYNKCEFISTTHLTNSFHALITQRAPIDKEATTTPQPTPAMPELNIFGILIRNIKVPNMLASHVLRSIWWFNCENRIKKSYYISKSK